ncbi:MAG TPA: 5-(carboxyamino)imidazole ribonucleotide mutase [Burkholderiaceae bacterium]|nr:5-(carboxyamino)imidazole ribonucleotide mutase [Burkholderiaceae bacterium]
MSDTTASTLTAKPEVGIIMGSSTDWPIMKYAAQILQHFDIAHETRVVSAHRMPLDMVDYAGKAAERGLRAVIAGAGGAAHLPGMVAALTPLPVFGVPIPTRHLQGQDSLLSIIQMPKGVPVATFAIGEAGAVNAALHVVACLAAFQPALQQRLAEYRAEQTQAARDMTLPPATDVQVDGP